MGDLSNLGGEKQNSESDTALSTIQMVKGRKFDCAFDHLKSLIQRVHISRVLLMCLLDVTGEKKRQKTAVHPRSQLPQQASSHLGVHFRN